MEIDYGYHKCSNCGRQDFMWGVKFGDSTFVCDICISDIKTKIEDRKKDAQNRTKQIDDGKLHLRD